MDDSLLLPRTVRMPDLAQGEWLNTSIQLTKSRLHGQLVLIDFWDYTCINCLRTIPYLREWYKRYAGLGLTIIGIHTPEFKFAKTRQHIEDAVQHLQLQYPILLDNEYENWDRFTTKAWPTKYLVDHNGYIRYQCQGEGFYQKTERTIQQLLRSRDPDVELPPLMPPLRNEDQPGAVCYRPSPELYAGYQSGGLFGGGLGNVSGYLPNETIFYQMPPLKEQAVGHFYLDGAWRALPESIAFAGQHGGRVSVPYQAAAVNAVLAPSPDPVSLALNLKESEAPSRVIVMQNGRMLDRGVAGQDIILDGDGRSFVIVEHPRMYQLVNQHQFENATLELTFQAKGLSLFSISFSSCVLQRGQQRVDAETYVVK